LLALVLVGAAGLPIGWELELGRLLTGEWRFCRLRAAVAIISTAVPAAIISTTVPAAIISTAICTPFISAVDAGNAPGC
jgi:hypothetical protein